MIKDKNMTQETPANTQSPTDFPIFIKLVRECFKLLSCRLFSLFISFLILTSAYLIDCYHQTPLYLEKFSAVVVIFGLILTIKHNFLKDLSSVETHINSNSGAMSFASSTPTESPKLVSKSFSIAYDECFRFTLIVLGTLLNVFGSFIPLVYLCKSTT